ncbi:tyrosine-type recombinase/integrase [Pseudoalteromonas sp. MMG022]|uniref:tyrosine-type recombinase/integrase n=1 Tax=Pseudoalteromonas sp. MMG022 TaxID=2909978 RepID=UPI001F00BB0A|nr:tyrosine-type recombinase/integrase [Pseudoalteromonas sp. MMG022]MCF6435979.1 tyrosine-type recombinase/integrase [Pseudoalteromonas sp. MMG022]
MQISETCEQFLAYCKTNKQLSTLTLKAYRQDLTTFQSLVREQEISEFDKKQLQNYLHRLQQTSLSVRTIKRRIACLKAMFRWLEREEFIQTNPFHKADISIKVPTQLPRNIPKSNLRKMLRTARTNLNICKHDSYNITTLSALIKTPKHLNQLTALLAIELLFATGVRVSELVNIDIKHIHLSEKKIKIFGKGQRERYVFIPSSEVVELIRAYLSLRNVTTAGHSLLLTNSRGKPASAHFIRKLIRETSHAAKLEKVTPHMYRHSAACQLLESGVDIRFVQRLLGHQSILTTQLYTHVNDNALQKQITKANTRGGIF